MVNKKQIDFEALNLRFKKEMKKEIGQRHALFLRNISKSFYSSDDEKFYILKDLSFNINPGDTIAVVGESGIGKSTLLQILGALDRPDSGEIIFRDQNIFEFDTNKLAKFRNEAIGFIFQFHHLLSEFTAVENVIMPLLIKGIDKQTAIEKAEIILNRVGLENRINHKVVEMSGGEQQRTAIARALILNPAILLADEPTGNLDKKNSRQFHNLLLELNADINMTMFIVTHNSELASLMKKRVTLVDGKLVEI